MKEKNSNDNKTGEKKTIEIHAIQIEKKLMRIKKNYRIMHLSFSFRTKSNG